MGENKGHGIKGPRHDDDVDDLGSSTAGGEIAPSGQPQPGNMQSGDLGESRQASRQSDQGNGSLQAGQQQAASKQQGNKQKGNKQSGRQGSMQSGQQGSQQQGGQHASGGTPALDDLGSRQGESAREASQAWSRDNGKQGRGHR